MSNIDEQFVEYIVKSLVGNPDKVELKRTIDEKGVLIELSVDPEDLGRVIGKRGATAQSIRTLLRALGTKNDARYNLKIVDTGDGRPPAKPTSEQEETESDTEPSESDEKTTEESEPEETEEQTAPEETDEDDDSDEEEDDDNYGDKTRRELKDLDDLDI